MDLSFNKHIDKVTSDFLFDAKLYHCSKFSFQKIAFLIYFFLELLYFLSYEKTLNFIEFIKKIYINKVILVICVCKATRR